LSLRAAGRVRKAVQGCKALMARQGLPQLVAQAREAALARKTEAVRAAANALASEVGPLAHALAGLGQLVLLRRRLAALLRLRCRLGAGLIHESLAVLDGSALAEAEADEEAAEADGQLPSLWDFVGDGRSSPEESSSCASAGSWHAPGSCPDLQSPVDSFCRVCRKAAHRWALMPCWRWRWCSTSLQPRP
ncbi:unnamed protein product, partial [Effrenium voratum]